jgi:NTE family protein
MNRVRITLFGILPFLSGSLLAQSQAPNEQNKPARPRIGLVLSGGSALGLSHVGVLQWLEEHHVPVTYIGGTSMGGLVGGLFATGYDSAEMKEFVRSIDWRNVLSPAPDFHDLAFRRKEDSRQFPNRLQLGLRKGVRLPPSISSGQEVGLALSQFAAPYGEYRSFDDLPTPFRCVATNLINGEQVVFKQGSLPIALRATMSLPGVFSPLKVDNMVLADGGMLNNLPVDVVKAMGADLIIAVALVDPEAPKESLESLVGVGKRSIAVMIDANERRSMAMADLLVVPDMTGLASSDFAKFEQMEQRGYEAAEKKKAFLLTLAVSDEEYARYVAERKRKRLPKKITPTFVVVKGVEDDRQEKSLEDTLGHELNGKPLDHETVENSLNGVAGLGPYQSAAYDFVKKDSADGLQVKVQPKTFAPPVMDTGINIDGSQASNIRFGMGARFTFFNFGGPNSELRTDLTVGQNTSVGVEYYYRLGLSRWFVAPRGYYSHREEDVYTGDTATSVLRVHEFDLGTDLGYAVSRFQELRLGYQYVHEDPVLSVGVYIPVLSEPPAGVHGARFLWSYDSQDSNIVPRHGIYSNMSANWNFGTPSGLSQFGVIQERVDVATPLGSRYSLIYTLGGGTVLGPKAYLPPFTMGGPDNLSSLGLGQLRGDRYFYGGIDALRAFSVDRSSYLNKVYLAIGAEAGKAFYGSNVGSPIYDGVLGVVAESPMGIIFLGGSYGSADSHRIFFRIGRLF